MLQELDPRLVQVTLDIGGQRRTLSPEMAVQFSVTKTANPLMNEATIKIANLAKAERDYILTNTTPYNRFRTRKRVILAVGRVSTGLTQLYSGEIMSCGIVQPPDIWIELKAKTGAFFNGQVGAVSMPASTKLSDIAGGLAKSLGTGLRFEADDKSVANYAHSGPMGKQVQKISETGNVDAYIDDDVLVVKNRSIGLRGTNVDISESTGMIGIPQWTDQGLQVKMLLNPAVRVGSRMTVKSVLNPASNGTYTIYKATYEGANRDTPWYITAETAPPFKSGLFMGNTNV